MTQMHIDGAAHIVKVVEAESCQYIFNLIDMEKEGAYALLPPAVLFAAAMAKLCPDCGYRDKNLHEGSLTRFEKGSWAPRPGILWMLYSVHAYSGWGDAKRPPSTVVANQTTGLRHAEGI
jgi:hypothetical protein